MSRRVATFVLLVVSVMVRADVCYLSGGTVMNGGGSNPTSVPTATATAQPVAPQFWMWLGGLYSYGDTCVDGQEVDPVTTVLRHASNQNQFHDVLHGIGLTYETDHQRYRDDTSCVDGEIGQADDGLTRICTNGIICASSRWHVRGNVVMGRSDPVGGYWGSFTPHRDSSDGSPADLCGHVVEDQVTVDGFSGTGFTIGRDWLYYKLVVERGYHFEGRQYWDNRKLMHQCNGDWSGSDGWTNVIWIS